MREVTKAAIVGGGVFLAGWVGWGLYSNRSAESVPYERLRTFDGVELRAYPQTVLVETTAPDQITAFRRLFGYISGANGGDESISMTTPVETRSGASVAMTAPVRSDSSGSGTDEVRMSFYLPSEYSPETVPIPTEPTVRLVVEPPKRVAARRFSWYAPEWRVARQERKLRSALEREGIDPRDDPYLLRYDDPWTPPFMRRNEVAVEVATDS
ncbi:SOUL family heme-binding protein [Halosimplex salinum]|uniref:SOUL family heme-binding protein n=1 Tax=Halosimplex salinum TaxID=1710538 RepID=UPI000F47424A|nr:heme-binding protein [Halosimplex salinum]